MGRLARLLARRDAACHCFDMAPPFTIQTDTSTVLLAPAKSCSSQPPRLVVASCAENVSFIHWFVQRGWSVTIIEKCGDDGSAAGGSSETNSSAAVQWIRLANIGREAHAYLWYIVHHWRTLQPTTVFLQGDAPRHVDLAAAPDLIGRFISECWSYASLVQMPHAALFRTGPDTWPKTWRGPGVPLSTYCELWRSFEAGEVSGRGGEDERNTLCPVWSAVGWASFIVARRTIHQRPRAAYERWLRSFEDNVTAHALWPTLGDNHSASVATGLDAVGPLARTGEPYDQRLGATFFERAWSLIFGCSEALSGCGYTANSSRTELLARCPMADARAPKNLSVKTSNNARVFALVKGEVRPCGCRAMHRLAAQNDTRLWH